MRLVLNGLGVYQRSTREINVELPTPILGVTVGSRLPYAFSVHGNYLAGAVCGVMDSMWTGKMEEGSNNSA